jgi:hypothetical protein
MSDAAPGAGTSLSKHFQSLLEYSDTLRPIALDPALVAQARSTILRASIPQIMFEQLRRFYGDDKRALQLDVIAGTGIEKVLRRRAGAGCRDQCRRSHEGGVQRGTRDSRHGSR